MDSVNACGISFRDRASRVTVFLYAVRKRTVNELVVSAVTLLTDCKHESQDICLFTCSWPASSRDRLQCRSPPPVHRGPTRSCCIPARYTLLETHTDTRRLDRHVDRFIYLCCVWWGYYIHLTHRTGRTHERHRWPQTRVLWWPQPPAGRPRHLVLYQRSLNIWRRRWQGCNGTFRPNSKTNIFTFHQKVYHVDTHHVCISKRHEDTESLPAFSCAKRCFHGTAVLCLNVNYVVFPKHT